MPPNIERLREYADEHVLYEIAMVAALRARMARYRTRLTQPAEHGSGDDELLDLAGRNADIERAQFHAGQDKGPILTMEWV